MLYIICSTGDNIGVLNRRRDLAVIADSEGVATTGDHRTNIIGLESFDDAKPFFLFVVSDSQLAVFSCAPESELHKNKRHEKIVPDCLCKQALVQRERKRDKPGDDGSSGNHGRASEKECLGRAEKGGRLKTAKKKKNGEEDEWGF